MGWRHSSIPLKDLQPGSRVQTRQRKKRLHVCVRACVFVEGRALFPCVSERCDGRVIARWDKGEIGFSLPTVCVLASAYRNPLGVRQPRARVPETFVRILLCQRPGSGVALTCRCHGRCMAMLPSGAVQAHPYPSPLSALSNSVLLHQAAAIMTPRLWRCQRGVDRLVNILTRLRYTCTSLS